MDRKSDYIQLPPLPRETDADTVRILWEYMRLSPDNRKQLKEDLQLAAFLSSLPDDEKVEAVEGEYVKVISEKELDGFRSAMQDMIGNLIVEISHLSCWVYEQIYVRGEKVGDLIKDHPEAADLIRIMNEEFASASRCSDS